MDHVPSTRRDEVRGLEVRRRLVDSTIGILRAEGVEAVQARRLAAELGTSTKAVYHYVGGMPQLMDAVADEGFQLVDRALDACGRSRDPVKDIARMGLAYRSFALDNPPLFRLMYGTPRLAAGSAVDLVAEAVGRAREAGRITARVTDPVAVELWTLVHGYVSLERAGTLDASVDLEAVFAPMMVNHLVGLGDERRRARRSLTAALA